MTSIGLRGPIMNYRKVIPIILAAKSLLGVLGVAALIGGGAALAAPAANADPYGSCGYSSPSISSPWGGFCDAPNMRPTGQHWPCEWGMGFSQCGWKPFRGS
jgi:hypothetical protein